jgi:hypothetical protein
VLSTLPSHTLAWLLSGSIRKLINEEGPIFGLGRTRPQGLNVRWLGIVCRPIEKGGLGIKKSGNPEYKPLTEIHP